MLSRSLFIAIMISLAFLGACTSTAGKKISGEQVGQIQKGITTKADINRMFGNPSSTARDPNGNDTWVFTYGEYKWITVPRSYHYDVHRQRLTISFAGDKVKYYQFTEQQPDEYR